MPYLGDSARLRLFNLVLVFAFLNPLSLSRRSGIDPILNRLFHYDSLFLIYFYLRSY